MTVANITLVGIETVTTDVANANISITVYGIENLITNSNPIVEATEFGFETITTNSNPIAGIATFGFESIHTAPQNQTQITVLGQEVVFINAVEIYATPLVYAPYAFAVF